MTVKVKLNLTKLRAIRSGIDTAIHAGAEETAKAVRDQAKALAPVRTGNLKSLIVAEPGENADVWRVVSYAEYAAFVEYGTRNMAAQPYLFPALARTNGLAIFGRNLAVLIK